jgi:nicotinamidase-related amidase
VPLIDHADCVLVVIDVQPGFGSDEPRERLHWLVSLARALGVPIVATEEAPERFGPSEVQPAFLKPSFGLAGTPAILEAVLGTGRSCAVLVGFETDVCVYQSAVGLLDAGLRVLVVEDATGSPGEFHERGLARVREAGAGLTHCKALAYEWVRTVAAAAAILPRPAPFPL